MNNIRNFCIISHIDHGKSTLADRFLELTKSVEGRKMQDQYLDSMDLERERGITIKLQPCRMKYNSDGNEYTLNLIDTPGHVDFSYEVSRTLAAVEGAILLVDASQGVQAQTLANLQLAKDQNLNIIPVVNKIDLPHAKVEESVKEISQLLGKDEQEVFKISAKEGKNVEPLLNEVVKKIPSPKGKINDPFRALIFDSVYDSYKGVLAYIRIIDGKIKSGEKIKMLASDAEAEVMEVGVLRPVFSKTDFLEAGDIGCIATGLKEIDSCRVGDTITSKENLSKVFSLPGYKEPKPMVFAGFFPKSADEYDVLKDALAKLRLNDASLSYEPESSEGLGRGFRCGFLGMLHLEIISERLKREYQLDLIVTSPSVRYKVKLKSKPDGADENYIIVSSATHLPEPHLVEDIQEPWVVLEVIAPSSYFGAIMKLLEKTRGEYKDVEYLTTERVVLKYEVPLSEIVIDFYDKLKNATQGYASMNYDLIGNKSADLVRLDVLVAGDQVEAFSRIVSRRNSYYEGRALVEKLKQVVPRQLFAVPLQAVIGSKVVARETIPAARKDVTAPLYGGDFSRKRKLLEKQKKGKKKMAQSGKVVLPHEVFLEVLKK